MKSITVIFEQNAVNTKELYHSVAATTGRQWLASLFSIFYFCVKIGLRAPANRYWNKGTTGKPHCRSFCVRAQSDAQDRNPFVISD
jgi:hypothetical protein